MLEVVFQRRPGGALSWVCRRCLGRPVRLLLVVVVATWQPVVVADAAVPGAGRLDRSFGDGGLVTTDRLGGANAVVVSSRGELVVAGEGFDVLRYDRDGAVDRAFGSGGRASAGFFEAGERAEGLVETAGGAVVAVGTAFRVRDDGVTDSDIALARFRRDGILDPTFGVGGKVTTDFAGTFDSGEAIVVQPDGKLVVAGTAGEGGGSRLALVRYLPNGALDPAFGDGGKVRLGGATDTSGATALVLQPDGKLVAAGSVGDSSVGATSFDFVVARFLPDGAPDPTFASTGYVTTDFAGSYDQASGLVLQRDGALVAAGTTTAENPPLNAYDFALVRYRPDGTLDRRFGRAGRVTTDFDGGADFAHAVTIQRDGRLVAAGGTLTVSTPGDFALARYRRDGTLDRRFGVGGTVTTDFAGDSDEARAVALQGNRRLVAAGVAFIGDFSGDYALARYRL
jgi:uncharacterized delta-60 repeat protein